VRVPPRQRDGTPGVAYKAHIDQVPARVIRTALGIVVLVAIVEGGGIRLTLFFILHDTGALPDPHILTRSFFRTPCLDPIVASSVVLARAGLIFRQ
jgi:hypothetical protein